MCGIRMAIVTVTLALEWVFKILNDRNRFSSFRHLANRNRATLNLRSEALLQGGTDLDTGLLIICALTFIIHLVGTLAYSVRIAGTRTRRIALSLRFSTFWSSYQEPQTHSPPLCWPS